MQYRTELTDRERLEDRSTIASLYGSHVIFKCDELDQGVPTFHAMGASDLTPIERDPEYDAVVLPSVHAVAFGKPCSTCWPGGEQA